MKPHHRRKECHLLAIQYTHLHLKRRWLANFRQWHFVARKASKTEVYEIPTRSEEGNPHLNGSSPQRATCVVPSQSFRHSLLSVVDINYSHYGGPRFCHVSTAAATTDCVLVFVVTAVAVETWKRVPCFSSLVALFSKSGRTVFATSGLRGLVSHAAHPTRQKAQAHGKRQGRQHHGRRQHDILVKVVVTIIASSLQGGRFDS